MATLSKHGEHVVIEYVWYRKAYCADGVILQNDGDGWKVTALLLDGHDWKEVAIRKIKERDLMYVERPVFARFANLVDTLIGDRYSRSVLYMELIVASDDPNKLMSLLNEYGLCADGTSPTLTIDGCTKLCEAYTAAMTEEREQRVERAQSA